MADEQRGLKNRNLQHYYESMLAMFETPGWKYLVEDLEKLHAVANTLAGISTQSDLDKRIGQIDILNMIITQPIVLRNAYDILLEDDSA